MTDYGSDFGQLGSLEQLAVIRHLHQQKIFGYKEAKAEQKCQHCGHVFEPY